MAVPVLVHGEEFWTSNKTEEDKIEGSEMKF